MQLTMVLIPRSQLRPVEGLACRSNRSSYACRPLRIVSGLTIRRIAAQSGLPKTDNLGSHNVVDARKPVPPDEGVV
jgi:hypothetical protein